MYCDSPVEVEAEEAEAPLPKGIPFEDTPV